MRLEPRARDLTALLGTDRPESADTEKPKNRRTDSDWVKTSVSMRPDTRRALKMWCIEHDMRIQEALDVMVRAYLNLDGDRPSNR